MGVVVSCLFSRVHTILLFLLLSCFCCLFRNGYSYHHVQRNNNTDELALLEFKEKLIDPLGALSSWNQSVHFCQWHGVTCSRRHQRVRRLDLVGKKLIGSVSPHIGNLTHLRHLRLRNNSLNGEIPPEIGRLRRLEYLFLCDNSISGKIPLNITGCPNMITICLSYNQLVGEIPVELCGLSELRGISIHKNHLTGNFPSCIGNLSSLVVISGTQNNFVGSIPNSLGQLRNLEVLTLGENNFSGTFPPQMFNISLLQVLTIQGNQLQGSLPSELGINLPNLVAFGIGLNNFSGTIPGTISNASNLQLFQISGNNFTGKVPLLGRLHNLKQLDLTSNNLGSGGIHKDDLSFIKSLINATNLEEMVINGNNFGGELPRCISNLSTSVTLLIMDNNQIDGSIPSGIGNLINLERLDLWNNNLRGHIRTEIGNLQKLMIFQLQGNIISGNIPSSLGNLSQLIQLNLQENRLQGIIPSSLGNCRNLVALDFSRNHLNGSISPQIFSLPLLSLYLDLSSNRLTGLLPMEVGNLRNLGEFSINDNMLTGELPSTLGSCIKLESLYMQGNSFQGSIPPSFNALRGLRVLDLSRNNFSGKIPEFLEGFQLLSLNLSHNNFEGNLLMKGVFRNATATSVEGNNKLCGGIPDFHLPKCNFNNGSKKRTLTIAMKIIISVISGLAGIIFLLSFLYFFCTRKKRKDPASRSTVNTIFSLSYQHLLKATNGFSSSNLIGMGSFGSVYKGFLDDRGMVIAVKVLNLLHHGASRSFLAECEALKNIRHRNLVKLLTVCSSIDYQGNDFKALVYEFMANGSLDKWLHPISAPDQEAQELQRNLDFLHRLNIAIDVAYALDYLHHHYETPIVHCDLKPSNVLLDSEMIGHISDFGLAKFLPEVALSLSTSQTSSLGIRGSIGYIAPEYSMGSEVSTYGDVYSYGILLLEIFTGKSPTDDMFRDNLNLHNFAKAMLPERVTEIVDPILLLEMRRDVNLNNTNNAYESLVFIIGIGVACSSQFPGERMSISDVAAQLSSVRGKFLRSNR